MVSHIAFYIIDSIYQVFLINLLHIICFMCSKWLNISSWPIEGTLTGTTTPTQTGPDGNGNEVVLYISESSRTCAYLSDVLVSYQRHSLGARGLTPLQRCGLLIQ